MVGICSQTVWYIYKQQNNNYNNIKTSYTWNLTLPVTSMTSRRRMIYVGTRSMNSVDDGVKGAEILSSLLSRKEHRNDTLDWL